MHLDEMGWQIKTLMIESTGKRNTVGSLEFNIRYTYPITPASTMWGAFTERGSNLKSRK
jgi:hypothetical protein